jgi:hypothetical protein
VPAAAILGLLVVVTAQSQTKFQYSARTQAPLKVKGNVTAGGIVWQCGGNQCTTTGPWPSPGVGSCAALARQIGYITYYGHSGAALSGEQLKQCNKGVSGPGSPAPSTTGTTGGTVTPAPAPAPVTPTIPTARITESTRAFDALLNKRTQIKQPLPGTTAQWQKQKRERVSVGNDCDDLRRDVNPGAAETCDMRDNNCDGQVDEGQTLLRFLDADGDGHGDPSRRVEACPFEISEVNRHAAATNSPWLVEVGNDCDDRDPRRWRGC